MSPPVQTRLFIALIAIALFCGCTAPAPRPAPPAVLVEDLPAEATPRARTSDWVYEEFSGVPLRVARYGRIRVHVMPGVATEPVWSAFRGVPWLEAMDDLLRRGDCLGLQIGMRRLLVEEARLVEDRLGLEWDLSRG